MEVPPPPPPPPPRPYYYRLETEFDMCLAITNQFFDDFFRDFLSEQHRTLEELFHDDLFHWTLEIPINAIDEDTGVSYEFEFYSVKIGYGLERYLRNGWPFFFHDRMLQSGQYIRFSKLDHYILGMKVWSPKEYTALFFHEEEDSDVGSPKDDSSVGSNECPERHDAPARQSGLSSLKITGINSVDLAGSERQKLTGEARVWLKEGGNINRSLSLLGKMVEPKSKKANYVRQHAPDFCHIRFICKGRLICTREGVKQPSLDVEERSSKSVENVQNDSGILSQKLHSSLRISNDDGSEGSSDRFIKTLRPCFSESSIRLPGPKSAFSSPCSSFSREGAPDSSLELLVLPQTKIEHQRSSPPSVLESSMNDDLYDQLVQAMEEADNSKREAFEGSMRRRKAEKEAINAIRKAKSAESLYFEEFRQRKEQEEELAKRKQELEFMKSQLEKVLKELQEALDWRLSLENQYEKSKITEKEMEEKMFSAVGLLQKYKTERDELQVERDHALREAEILRKQLDQEPSSSHVPFFFSEFSFSDLEKAANNFDPSLKIGEGGYGSIYKGFLRQTQVAIKILNPNSMQGPQEFEQEVDVLSKLWHPNLVTLIGACHESWALVYEYLSGGSLEDRLICKDNTPPLPWQTRIQIATDLCVILIFLHSSRPTSIIHGDIKPSNILLDENFVCKLSDFGICFVISHTETSMEQTTRFCTSQPKGTFSYMDPEFLTTGELTPKCDIYSFGIILLRLLTGRPAMGITKEVEYALSNGNLNCLLDPSAGDWPFVQAEQLARMALRCCEMNGRNRPDLESYVWRVLEPMKASSRSLSMPWLASDDRAPHYFICPIFQEIMEDPQIASDGFTYEAEAIRGWLDSGHDTSPMTNAKLAKHDFIPNHALRSAIQE